METDKKEEMAKKEDALKKLRQWLIRQAGAQEISVIQDSVGPLRKEGQVTIRRIFTIKLVPALDQDSIYRIISGFGKKVEHLGLSNSVALKIDTSEPPLGTQD